MQGATKTLKKDSINYKKLFFELMIVLFVIFVITLVVVLSILKEHGAFDEGDKYENFRSIVDEVDNYDYSKGRDRELENRIEDVWYNSNRVDETYFYGLARAVYYCNIGYYNTAEDTFYIIENFTPDGELADLSAHEVICERKQNGES